MLDPEARRILAELAEAPDAVVPGRPGFDLARTRRDSLALSVARAKRRPGVPVARVADLDVDGVRCRLIADRADLPVVVYLHGGGWTLGSPEECETFCRSLAGRSGWAVVVPEYRLAPEHPYPAALEDVERVVRWLRRRGDAVGLDASRLALAGESAGANLAAAVALRTRDRGEPGFVLQVLLCPAVDLAGDYPSRGEFGRGFGLDRETMAWSMAAYVPDPRDRARPDVSPLRAPSLAGLPPTLVATAEHDPLRDEGEAYAARLADAGISVTATRYLGTIHFFTDPTRFDAGDAVVDQVASALSRLAKTPQKSGAAGSPA